MVDVFPLVCSRDCVLRLLMLNKDAVASGYTNVVWKILGDIFVPHKEKMEGKGHQVIRYLVVLMMMITRVSLRRFIKF